LPPIVDETVADVRPRVNRILVWAEEVSGIKAAIAIAKSVSPISFFIIFSFDSRSEAVTTRSDMLMSRIRKYFRKLRQPAYQTKNRVR